MRPLGAAFRTPVDVAAKSKNHGDGVTYGTPKRLFGNVKSSRTVVRGPQGETNTRPMVVELPHTAQVSTGDQISAAGDTGIVSVVQVIPGAFGVPHHIEVQAS